MFGVQSWVALRRETGERALYVLTGAAGIAGARHPAVQLPVFRTGDAIHLAARKAGRFAPVPDERGVIPVPE